MSEHVMSLHEIIAGLYLAAIIVQRAPAQYGYYIRSETALFSSTLKDYKLRTRLKKIKIKKPVALCV